VSEREQIERLWIRSDPGRFRVARRWLSGILSEAGWYGEEVRDVVVAVSEACSNAHRYGYEGRMDGKIDLEIALSPDRAEIRVRDYGRGFDPERYRAPDLSRPLEGGYGIHLMKGLTDHLEHRAMEEGTLVLMTKVRRSPVPCGGAAAQGAWGRE